MSMFLHRFEAIEPRMASQLCPRGTTSRVHVLRLRRHFQNDRMSRQATSTVQVHDRESEDAWTVDQTSSFSPDHGEQRGEDTSLEARPARPTKPYIKEFTKELLKNREIGDRRERKYFDEGRVYVRRWLTRNPSVLPPLGHGDALVGSGFRTLNKNTNDLSDLNRALRTGDPHSILRSFMLLIHFDADGFFHTEALASIPPATFSEILQCLEPRGFVGTRYTTLHQDMHPKEHNFLNLPPLDYYHFRTLFISQISGIVTARNKCAPLSIADYRFLLGCARATANRKLATTIWNIMRDKRIQPDLECYNHYLCVLCWSDNMHIFHKSYLRVIPWEIERRSGELSPRVRSGGFRVGQDGIKAQATQIFGEMARKGIFGNEETFCLLMTALAREGDIPGVETLLKRVWGIDVAEIGSPNQGSRKPRPQPPNPYNTDSPFYPSGRLLYTLAHIYGSNNAIPTALSIIDYVSQQYSLTISLGVWKELLRWTHVLSVEPHRRSRMPAEEGWLTGQLPLESMRSLWAIMVSEPYNVKPTMAMYDLMIRNFISSGSIGKARGLMKETRKLHQAAVQEYTSCRLLLAQCVNKKGSLQERLRLSRDVHYTKLRWRRSVLYLRRWVSMLITTMNRSISDHNSYALPDVIREWSSFLPHRVNYVIDRQLVQIKTPYKTVARARNAQFRKLTLGSPTSRRLEERRAKALRERARLQRGHDELILDGDSQPFAAEF